jgi:hypothetical protein
MEARIESSKRVLDVRTSFSLGYARYKQEVENRQGKGHDQAGYEGRVAAEVKPSGVSMPSVTRADDTSRMAGAQDAIMSRADSSSQRKAYVNMTPELPMPKRATKNASPNDSISSMMALAMKLPCFSAILAPLFQVVWP